MLAELERWCEQVGLVQDHDLVRDYQLAIAFHQTHDHPHCLYQRGVFSYLASLSPDTTPNARVMALLSALQSTHSDDPAWIRRFEQWYWQSICALEAPAIQLLKDNLPIYVQQAEQSDQTVIEVYHSTILSRLDHCLQQPEWPPAIRSRLQQLRQSILALGSPGCELVFLVVPATLNPPHLGHQTMAQQALLAYPEAAGLIWSVGKPSDKTPSYSEAERVWLMQRKTPFAVTTHGDHIQRTLKLCGVLQGTGKVCLVRGIRGPQDIEHEQMQREFVDHYQRVQGLPVGAIQFYAYQADANVAEISSSRIRQAQVAQSNNEILEEHKRALSWRLADRYPPSLIASLAQRKIVIRGVVGSMASGKSRLLAQWKQQGMQTVDLDQLWAECLQDASLIDQIGVLFTEAVLAPGKLNKDWLREQVFSGEPRVCRQLESFAQPLVLRRLIDRVLALPDSTEVAVEISAPNSVFAPLLKQLVQHWWIVSRPADDVLMSIVDRLHVDQSTAITYYQRSILQVGAFVQGLPESIVTRVKG